MPLDRVNLEVTLEMAPDAQEAASGNLSEALPEGVAAALAVVHQLRHEHSAARRSPADLLREDKVALQLLVHLRPNGLNGEIGRPDLERCNALCCCHQKDKAKDMRTKP